MKYLLNIKYFFKGYEYKEYNLFLSEKGMQEIWRDHPKINIFLLYMKDNKTYIY